MLAKLQEDFITSLKQDEMENFVKEQMLAPPGLSDESAFNIYRHNMYVGLVEALKNTYPLTHKAIGEKAFRQVAFSFARKHHPTTNICLLRYHPGFANVIGDNINEAYLQELAKLEYEMNEIYHASNDNYVSSQQLEYLDTSRSKFVLVSTAKLFDSKWNLSVIYDALSNSDNPGYQVEKLSEDILIYRDINYKVCIYKLNVTTKALLEIMQEKSIEDTISELCNMGFEEPSISQSLFELVSLQVIKVEAANA
jgi:hypothetical protein